MYAPKPIPAGLNTSLSLRLRILIVALLPLLVGVGLFAAYFAHRTISQAETALDAQGRNAAQRLAESVALDLFSGNLPYVKRLVDLERHSLHALSIAITDGQQWILVSGTATPLPPPHGAPPAFQRTGPLYHFAHPILLSAPVDADPYLEGAPPPSHNTAYIVVTLSRDPIELTRAQVGLAASGMAVLCVTLALTLAWRLSGTVSDPLREITHAVGLISQGNLSERVEENAVGEVGQLQQGVNRMAAALEEHQHVLERRIHEATDELRNQKQAAETATQAKSRFLAAASHDLRQPLHAMSLLVEALQERATDEETHRLTQHIASSANAMTTLLNALLDLSRLDAGVVEAKLTCFPLKQVFESLQHQFSPLAKAKGLRLCVHSSQAWIHTDPALLERILANLIANALRYTQTGWVLVGVRHAANDRIKLEVRDTGPGIPEAFQARIFEEYFQLANPERQRDKGLGLGLAIVSRLAKLLGTCVNLKSHPGRGTCFCLDFSRCPAQQETPAIVSPPLVIPLEHALVAFIDDDESILAAMLEIFDDWGIDLAVGENALQVQRELEELGRTPDLILSDYRLKEGLTGIQAIATLRAAFGPIPAVLITGDTGADTIQEIREAGIPVLHKPVKPAKLRAYLAHLFTHPSAPP